MKRTITRSDIHIYETLFERGCYRAYIRGQAQLEAWGPSKEEALRNLVTVLLQTKNISFNLNY